MTTKVELTQSRLKELVTYDPLIGEMTWIVTKSKLTPAGSLVGYVNRKGYRATNIDGKSYLVSRLIWLYVTGDFPKRFIDHKDRNRLNNKWDNLRESTNSQNSANRKDIIKDVPRNIEYCDNRKKPYRVRIRHDGKIHYFGYFENIEDAKLVAIEKSKELHGEFSFHV